VEQDNLNTNAEKRMDTTTAALVVVSIAIIGAVAYSKSNAISPFVNIADAGTDKPVIWIYLNNSEINSRSWGDFMGRSSHAINLPFLNLCYQTIVAKNSDIYRVEVIGGLADLALRMGGWDSLPIALQNPEAVVREPELNWIRAAVLAKWGGLWVSPATISIKPFGPLPKKRIVFFGTDTFPAYGGSSVIPAMNVIWSPTPEHPLWKIWEEKARIRLDRRSGGSEFRYDEKSDLADALREFKNDCILMPTAELSRKGSSLKRIELEDLLASGTQGDLPFTIPKEAVYLPIPFSELLQRSAFEWFLRMSEDQIINSDVVLSYFFR
jgi:hypothetical protein